MTFPHQGTPPSHRANDCSPDTPDPSGRSGRLKPTDTIVALLCALIAVGAAVLCVLATQGGPPDPTALIKLAADDPLAVQARQTDPGFVLVDRVEHYDGVYYYAIARDPLLLGDEHTRIDQAPYRYGHPFYGWAARVLSLGSDRAVPAALLMLSLVGIGFAGWAVSRLSVLFGRTPWGGLLVAASPGLLYAVSVSTTEAFAAGLLACALLAWLRGRIVLAGVLMVALCLTKEQYVTVPVGLALWELVQRGRTGAWSDRWRTRAVALAAGPITLAAWYVYVRAQVSQWPNDYEDGNLGAPFVGWFEAFDKARALAAGSFSQSQIGTTATPMLIAVAVVLVAAFVKALRLRSPLDGIVLGMVAIAACMGWLTLLYPHELVRNPSIVLLLAIGSLLAGPYRAPGASPTPSPAPAPPLDAAGSPAPAPPPP